MSVWPPDWADLISGTKCPMCSAGRPESDTFGVRVYAGVYSDAYLQRAAIQRGYTVVIWRGRHVTEPTELSAWARIRFLFAVLRTCRKPMCGCGRMRPQPRSPGCHPRWRWVRAAAHLGCVD